MSEDLARLLKLYHPNTKEGNYQADVAWRGGNRVLAAAIETLGLATEAEVHEHFKRLDQEQSDRLEAACRRAEVAARQRAGGADA